MNKIVLQQKKDIDHGKEEWKNQKVDVYTVWIMALTTVLLGCAATTPVVVILRISFL